MARFSLVDGEVVIEAESQVFKIESPFLSDGDSLRLYSKLPDDYIVFQAGCLPGDGGLYIDFICLKDLSEFRRWKVDGSGQYESQEKIGLVALQRATGFAQLKIDPDKMCKLMQKYDNDFVVYSVVSELFGIEDALCFLNKQAAMIPISNRDESVQLVIIFNHNYVRNCGPLYNHYSKRFGRIDFVLPCIAPDHGNFYSYSFGSFQFHGLILNYLIDKLKNKNEKIKHFIFIQDDLLLHPSIDSRNYESKLSLKGNSFSSGEYGRYSPRENWGWADRINISLTDQRCAIGGNGFEGFIPFIAGYELYRGFSDYFALEADAAECFVDYLKPYVAANIFPELAIPSVLCAAGRRLSKTLAKVPGEILWDEKHKVYAPDFLNEFIASEKVYLHPFKLARASGELIKLLDAVA